MPARLGFTVERRAAAADEIESALARLGHEPGCYLGCDAGVPGLHPLQATLLVAPSLALEVYEDGAEVEALDGLGRALMRHPALAEFKAAAHRGSDASAIVAARAFLAAFGAEAGDDRSGVRWVGAFRFECHRLARAVDARDPTLGVQGGAGVRLAAASSLGVLYFSPAIRLRDAHGNWQLSSIRFDDAELAAAACGARDGALAALAQATVEATRAPASAPAEPAVHDDRTSPVDAHLAEPEDDFAPGGYAAVVQRALGPLAGDALVSLTLSQSFRRRVGEVSAAAAFARLRQANPAPATFFYAARDGERLFGASPDLQLVVSGRDGAVVALPVCGTVARGHGPVGEAESLRALLDEEVDAASLAVCTDALRNDLAPLCVPGSLKLLDRRRPMALATVVHTVDRLQGRLRAGCDAWDAIVATAAPVMVTGTPRRTALAAIEALEAGPRGWYGGLVVDVAANGDARVGTILRAAALKDGIAEVRTGGDLLADSDPAREEHESRVKAVSLWRALGLAVDAGLQATLAGAPVLRADDGSTADGPRVMALRAVNLRAAGDPYAAALAEALSGLGTTLDDAAPVVVLAGTGIVRGDEAVIAVGDAAYRLLGDNGFEVVRIRPEHGRLVRCTPAATPVGLPVHPFIAMRSATLALGGGAADSEADERWAVWVRDDAGRPLVLARSNRRYVCLLIRPESLLSDLAALGVLRYALEFVDRHNRRS